MGFEVGLTGESLFAAFNFASMDFDRGCGNVWGRGRTRDHCERSREGRERGEEKRQRGGTVEKRGMNEGTGGWTGDGERGWVRKRRKGGRGVEGCEKH